jgi:3-hydroxyacyl-[acyl-carrier-protein] dehydratase
MPPRLLFDISAIDFNKILFDHEAVREINPQRGDMEHLDAILYADTEHDRLVGIKDVRADEFWVAGHIPGRPLLPGVIMIESAAQLSAFYVKKFKGWKGFVGFGGVEECKFRSQVPPGKRMILLGELLWERHHRMCSAVQGIVDGAIAFETRVVGTEL